MILLKRVGYMLWLLLGQTISVISMIAAAGFIFWGLLWLDMKLDGLLFPIALLAIAVAVIIGGVVATVIDAWHTARRKIE